MKILESLPSSTKNHKTLKTNTLQRYEKKQSNKKKSNGKKIAGMDKKNLPQIRLFTGGDDLTKDWFVEYYELKGVTKIRKQVKGGINRGKTIDERKEIATRLISAIQKELPPAKVSGYATKTLRGQLSDALERICEPLRPKSRQSYAAKLNTFLNWCDQQNIKYAKGLTPEHVKAFFVYLKNDRKLHNTTIENYRERLKTLFTEGVGGANVLKDIKPIRGEVTPAKPYQKHHLDKLKKHISAENPQLWLFIQFIIYCLIRPNSELRLLKIEYIDFENGLLCVPAHIAKNKKTQWVKIPRVLMPQIEHLKTYPPSYYIFSKAGEPAPVAASYNYFYNQHVKILKLLGLKITGYNLYSYKHFGAVTMVRAGVPLMEVKEQGRWHSLDQMTDYLKAFGVKDLGTIENVELV